MVFLALGQKMRQIYTESQRRKFVSDYEKSSLSVKDYCQARNISTCLYYHWKKRLEQEASMVEPDALLPQFRQVVMPTRVTGFSMTLPNGIRIGLEGMSLEDLSRLLVSMGRHA
jgi:hypothetical protein